MRNQTALPRLARVIAPLLAVALGLAGAVALTGTAEAAVIGTVTADPVSGNNGTVITLDTSGACLASRGDSTIVSVAGNGINADTQNIVGITPNTSWLPNAAGGYRIVVGTMSDFANLQSPAATLSGRYDFTVKCKNGIGATVFDTYEGSIYYTGANAWANALPTTTTTVSATPAVQASLGASVALKATVAPSGAAGSVQFKDNGVDLGSPVTVVAGIATLSTSALALGGHPVTAVFTPADPLSFAPSTSATFSYSIVTPSAPSVVHAAAASGTYRVGSTLTCSATFADATSTAYAWLNNGSVIGGATSTKLVLTGAYANRTIACRATGTNTVGSTPSTSAGHKIALGAAPVAKSKPAISGKAKKGKTLTCSAGTWSQSGLTYSYQWKRGGKAIAGATKAKHKVVKKDKGKKLTCTVTVVKTGYAPGTATSASKKVSSK